MASRGVQPALGLLLAGLAQACSFETEAQRRAEVRFRVDVAIDDGGVRRTGSGVWSFTLEKAAVPLVAPFNSRFEAEAIPIKRDDGGWLFVMPQHVDFGGSGAKWPELAFDYSGEVRGSGPRNGPEALSRLAVQKGLKATVSCLHDPDELRRMRGGILCPTVLEAERLEDPQSFKRLNTDPNSEGFGGVRIDSLTITITDQPVTRQLNMMLPWLRKIARLGNSDDERAYAKYTFGQIPDFLLYIRVPLYDKEK